MSERIVLGGKLTNLQDPVQLGRLNDLLAQILGIVNAFDQNSFALAWIEGAAAGQVIASKGNGVAPEWDPSPTLTVATFSGLTVSQLVVTSAAKALASQAPVGTYTPSNVTPDRSYDADATTLAEVADVLGTLIADLKTAKVIG